MEATLLRVDKVITLGQARRWGMDTRALGSPRVVSSKFGPLIAFVHPSAHGVRDDMLMHLAGVGEMRRLLKARPEDWELADFAQIDYPGRIPDAVWHFKGERIAVEFDAGDYSRERIARKLASYHMSFDDQVWGTPIRSRLEHIKKLAGGLPLRAMLVKL